jgi:hypothetical protein
MLNTGPGDSLEDQCTFFRLERSNWCGAAVRVSDGTVLPRLQRRWGGEIRGRRRGGEGGGVKRMRAMRMRLEWCSHAASRLCRRPDLQRSVSRCDGISASVSSVDSTSSA